MSKVITDSARLEFLSQLYFDNIWWDKSKSLWFIGNKKDSYPSSSDITLRGAIDRLIPYQDKNIYLKKEVAVWVDTVFGGYEDYEFVEIDDPKDILRLNFFDLKLFNLLKFSYLRNLWEIGTIEPEISASSGSNIRIAVDNLLGLKIARFSTVF